MTTIASSSRPTVSSDTSRPARGAQVIHGVKWTLSAPVVVALVTAALTATVVPFLTREWQNHEKRINLKTAIAVDMSRSTANAIGAGRRVGTGVVYAVTADPRVNRAVIQDAYNRGLGQWQVDTGRLSAQLLARFGGREIVDDWRHFAQAVELFYKLGAVIPAEDRGRFVRSLRHYLTTGPSVNEGRWASVWPALLDRPSAKERRGNLKEFRAKQLTFRRKYAQVADRLLLVGNQLVEELLTLNPKV